MAWLTKNESEAAKSQASCCFWPITSVMAVKKSRWRRLGTKPATVTSPEVGWRRPESILSVVVLPAPFAPKKPTISPAAISSVTPRTASTVLYRRLKKARSEPLSPASFS